MVRSAGQTETASRKTTPSLVVALISFGCLAVLYWLLSFAVENPDGVSALPFMVPALPVSIGTQVAYIVALASLAWFLWRDAGRVGGLVRWACRIVGLVLSLIGLFLVALALASGTGIRSAVLGVLSAVLAMAVIGGATWSFRWDRAGAKSPQG